MDAGIRRRALRLISNGVYVLTARTRERCGAATITWVSQASFKPPLLMAAVRAKSNVFRCLQESGRAALHIVDETQQELAHRFFHTTAEGSGTINGEPVIAGKTEAPVLESLPAYVECEVERIVETGGDHRVVILRVVEAQCREAVRPLTLAQTPWQYGG